MAPAFEAAGDRHLPGRRIHEERFHGIISESQIALQGQIRTFTPLAGIPFRIPFRIAQGASIARVLPLNEGTRAAMRIVFVCNELPPASAGGIGPAVATLARGLARLGHPVTVVGVYDEDHRWHLPGVEVRPLTRAYSVWFRPFFRKHDLRRLAIYRELRRLKKGPGVDVVEWPDYEGLFWKPIPGVIDVVRNHGPRISHRLHGLAQYHPHWEKLEFRTLRTIPNWIGVSKWFMDEWLRITGARPARSTVVYNPVDLSLFHPETDPSQVDPYRVLYAGTLMQRKGVLSLLKAANLFLRDCPDARLHVTGREFEKIPDLEAILDDAVRDRVTLAYPMPQARLARLMRRSALFAMPSVLESFGNVWAEAMASGIPVVGSRLTCGPEIVPTDVAGLLADPARPEEIAQQVVRLLRDPNLRQRMGQSGRRIAESRFSLDVGVSRTLEFYRCCLEERPLPEHLSRLPGEA